MTVPNRFQNAAGNYPDADKYMQDWDYLDSLMRGNFLLNPGQETWGTTSFSNPADGTTLSDNWVLEKGGTSGATADITRESTTKDTGSYGGKVNISGAGSANSYLKIKQSLTEYAGFGGETMLFGMKVKVATASKVRLSIYDGSSTAYSTYHTGDGTWQKLYVSLAMQSVPTALTVKLEITSDAVDAVYYDSGFLYAIPALADTTTKAALAFVGTNDLPSLIIPGEIKMYGGATAPTGYLLCDASAISRTTYAALFAVIGTTFGVGDGSTTFNVPDMRGRIPVGVGTGTGGGAAGTGLPTGGAALTARARGAWTGAETHTLTTAEMPAHTHQYTYMETAVNGNDNLNIPALENSANPTGATISSSTGGGGAHNNVQPMMCLNFIIKT